MEKLLISELYRIQQLMGKTLIAEQPMQYADDVLKFIGKISPRLGDETLDLAKILKNAKTDAEILEILARISKSNDELANYIAPKILSNLTDAQNEALNQLKNYLRTQIKNKKMSKAAAEMLVNNWINKNVQTEFDGVTKLLKQRLDDFIDTEFRNITVEPSLNPKPKNVTDVAGQTWENIKPISTEELKKLEKLYRKKGLGSSFYKALKQFSKLVSDMMTKQFELMDETLSLIKSLANESNAAYKTDILRKIGDNVKLLTQRDKDNYKIINEWIDTNVLDYKLKGKIKDLEGYQKAAALLPPETLETWRKTYGAFKDRRLKLLKQANSMLNPLSWFGDSIEKWKGTSNSAKRKAKWKAFLSGPEFAELRRWGFLGQTQSWEGIKKYANQFGTLPAVLNVSKELVYSYVVLSAVMAFLDYITDLLGNGIRNVPYINEWGPVYKQILSYDEHIKKEDPTFDWEAIEGYKHFFGDIRDYWADELKDLNVFFPGLFDNLGSFLEFFRTLTLSKESIDKAIAETNRLKEKTEEARQKVVEKAEDAAKKVKVGVEKIENSETGFKVFIKTTWIDKENGESQLNGSETYTKNGDNYTITQDGEPYNYKWNGKTFEFIP